MASSYYAATQYQAAAEWFDYYLALAPTDANGRAYYGICLDRLGRRADAEAAWRLALKIDPTNTMARALLNR